MTRLRLPTAQRRPPVALAIVGGFLMMASMPSAGVDERSLSFYHTHTGRHLEVVYTVGGEYVGSALDQIDVFLGDFRTGDTYSIDPQLIDLIYDLRESLGGNGTYEVISAYRSPETNEMLRNSSAGVARSSQHLLGKAIDLRLTGVDLERLRDAAVALQRGGVGYYPDSNLVHIDTGRVRRW